MDDFAEVVGVIVITIIALFVLSLLFAWPIQLLWNSTMPDVFDLKSITFWQAFRLNLLFGLLIRSTPSKSKD